MATEASGERQAPVGDTQTRDTQSRSLPGDQTDDAGLPPGFLDSDATDPDEPKGRFSARIEQLRNRAEQASQEYLELANEQPVYALPMVFVSRYIARQGMLLASAVAFRVFLWLVPVALLAAGIASWLSGMFPGFAAALADASGVTGIAARQMTTTITDGRQSWWVAAVVGLVGMLWTTRTLVRNLIVANAHTWGATIPRRRRQKDVMITSLLFDGLWFFTIVAGVLAARLDRYFPGKIIISVVVHAVIISVAWFVVSSRLPDRRHSLADLIPGAVLFGTCMGLVILVGRVYLPARLEHSAAIYGSLGIAASILVWLLVIGQLVVASSLVNVVWLDFRAQQAQLAGGVAAPQGGLAPLRAIYRTLRGSRPPGDPGRGT